MHAPFGSRAEVHRHYRHGYSGYKLRKEGRQVKEEKDGQWKEREGEKVK